MQSLTGAAQTWLVVKVPATVAGESETSRAKSRLSGLCEPLPVPSRLMSQNTPAAKKPRGATTPPSTAWHRNLFTEAPTKAQIAGAVKAAVSDAASWQHLGRLEPV